MRIVDYSKERMLYASPNGELTYKRGTIRYRDNNEVKEVNIGGKLNRFPLIERLTRKEPRCAARVDNDHLIFSFEGKIYNYCISSNSICLEHTFSKGMNNPLEFLSIKNAAGAENTIMYGEYIWNSMKGPVSIYKRQKGEWECAYTFPKNTITHIHNIINDEYRRGYIILTGDEDAESGIWFADYEFNNVRPILHGKQQYRACVAFPVKDGIYYATDTPLEDNYIYFAKINSNCDVEHINVECKIAGPCIYGCYHDEAMYFATSVEPDSSLKKWRYRLTYKLGDGVEDRYTHIIRRTREGKYQEVSKIKKDSLPMWLFQFGNMVFPQNESDSVYGVLQATVKGHGITVKIED